MDPSNIIKQRYESEKSRLQNEFNTEWNVLQSRGAQDKDFMALHDRYRQLANQLNTSTQGRIDSLNEITELGRQGLISDPGMAQLRSILPPETRSALPKVPKQVDTMAEYGKLDVYLNRLEGDLSRFVQDPGGKKIKDPLKWWWQESKTKPILYVNTGMKVPGEGGRLKADLRMATQEEQSEFVRKQLEIKRVRQMQKALMSSPNITNRLQRAAASSNRLGVGTIGGNILSELEDRKPTPKLEELDATTAMALLQEAGNDKNKARELAKQRGYKF